MAKSIEAGTSKHRRSIRLDHRDYSFPGTYFVTVCSFEWRSVFGRIQDAAFMPSGLGRLVQESWVAIPLHFSHVALHEFVVMPNHLHGLVAIVRKPSTAPVTAAAPTAVASAVKSPPLIVPTPLVGAQHGCALPPGELCQAAVTPGSIGAIVRSFKSIVTKRAHQELHWNGPIWQRNYFERVLRDAKEFADASRYIAENPKKWAWDRENPEFRAR